MQGFFLGRCQRQLTVHSSDLYIFLTVSQLFMLFETIMAAVSSPASNMTFSQSLTQWQTSSCDNQTDCRTQQEPKIAQQQQQPSSEMELKQRGSLPEHAQNVASQDVNSSPLSQRQYQDKCHVGQTVQVPLQNPQTSGTQDPGKYTVHNHKPVKTHDPSGELQYLKLQQMNNQQATFSEEPSSQIKHTIQVPFTTLLPLLLCQLPKDRAMQLQTMFVKLKVVFSNSFCLFSRLDFFF